DPGCCHGGKHCQEPVMATVHVGANADPHPSIILVPPEGWPVPTEGRRASSTPLRSHPSCRMTTRGGRHSHPLSFSSSKKERPRFSPEKRPSASTVPMLMGYGAAVK